MREALLDLLTGHGVGLPLLCYALAGLLVFLVAARLARHADAIADVSGLGRAWIGALLLAASTSLPELATALNAGALGAVDIGIGDLLGASLVNMLLLAVIDLGWPGRGVLERAAPEQAFVGALAIVMLGTAAAALASGGWGRVGPLGVESLVLVVLYVGGMRSASTLLRPAAPPDQMELGESRRTVLWQGVRGFAIAALGLLLAAPLLVLSAEAIALEAGITDSFVGTVLVGLTTTLPEIAATVVAVRLGAVDLAVGNAFGSIAFNVLILVPMDLVQADGALLAHASPDHLRTAILAMVAVALGLLGMLAARRHGRFRLGSVMIVLAWLAAGVLLA